MEMKKYKTDGNQLPKSVTKKNGTTEVDPVKMIVWIIYGSQWTSTSNL